MLSNIWSREWSNSSRPPHCTAINPKAKQIKYLTFRCSGISSNFTSINSNSQTLKHQITHDTNWHPGKMLAKGKHFPPLPAPSPQSPFLTCSAPPFPKAACAIYFLAEKWFSVPSEFCAIFGIILKCKITPQPVVPPRLTHTLLVSNLCRRSSSSQRQV